MHPHNALSVLILEDNLYAVAALAKQLGILEDVLLDHGRDLHVTVYPVAEYIELVNVSSVRVDVIVLDRDDKEGGSFHTIDIKKFGPERIIATSAVDEWNRLLTKQGVTHVAQKDYLDLEAWAQQVVKHIREITGS